MIVIVGESASGKSSVAKYLTNNCGYKRIITYTTRAPRHNEVDGFDYYFIQEDQFEKLDKQDFFARRLDAFEKDGVKDLKLGMKTSKEAQDQEFAGLKQIKRGISSSKLGRAKEQEGMSKLEEGQKMIAEGKAKGQAGSESVKLGNALIEAGNSLIEEGRSMQEQGDLIIEEGIGLLFLADEIEDSLLA